MTKPIYYVVDERGARLCGDWIYREFAMFGTYDSCVKVYKSKKAAADAAIDTGGKVLELNREMESEMDAAGNFYSEAEEKYFKIKDLLAGVVTSAAVRVLSDER